MRRSRATSAGTRSDPVWNITVSNMRNETRREFRKASGSSRGVKKKKGNSIDQLTRVLNYVGLV